MKELAPHVLGLDPRSPAAVDQKMDSIMLSGNAAKALIDLACWDIFGKSVGLPTYTLLGGALCHSLPAFTVIGLGSPETGVKKALAESERLPHCNSRLEMIRLTMRNESEPYKALPSNVVLAIDGTEGGIGRSYTGQ